MKTRLAKPRSGMAFSRSADCRRRGRTGERGSAVVIFLALLAIMLVLVAANGKTLVLLKKELQLIEHKQVQRLERSQTNAVSPASLEAKPTPALP